MANMVSWSIHFINAPGSLFFDNQLVEMAGFRFEEDLCAYVNLAER
jgi:hypothetical protein